MWYTSIEQSNVGTRLNLNLIRQPVETPPDYRWVMSTSFRNYCIIWKEETPLLNLLIDYATMFIRWWSLVVHLAVRDECKRPLPHMRWSCWNCLSSLHLTVQSSWVASKHLCSAHIECQCSGLLKITAHHIIWGHKNIYCTHRNFSDLTIIAIMATRRKTLLKLSLYFF